MTIPEGLIGLLKDEDRQVRARAARALGEMGPAAACAVLALAAVVADPECDPVVRADAAVALGRIGVAAMPAIPMLVAVANEPDEADEEEELLRREARWAERMIRIAAGLPSGEVE